MTDVILETDPETEERCKQTREAYKQVEKERKQKLYRRQKLIGNHRTFLISHELDKRLRDEANKRGIPITEMVRICLNTSLNLWK